MEDVGNQPSMDDQQAAPRPRIVFGVQTPQQTEEDPSELQEQREKHKQRHVQRVCSSHAATAPPQG